MSKLHFYRKIGDYITKFADGEGSPKTSGEFQTLITWGTVVAGYEYLIAQGQHPPVERYHCLTGARAGGTAKFQKAPTDVASYDEEFLGSALALNALVEATSKRVTIEIDSSDLSELKSADYKLCFAKKIAGQDYNVVWQSYTKYLSNNIFSWTPQYQLFGSNTFHAQVQVQVSTNSVTIGLGEESTLDSSGVLQAPKTGGTETAITMINEYGSIHPGINQLSTGIDGTQTSSPIYVAKNPVVLGETEMTPIEKVLVWFEQNIETSTMFSTSRSNSVEIDLTSTNDATRLYQGQKWVTP